MEKQLVQFKIRKDTYSRLKEKAVNDEVPISQILRGLVNSLLMKCETVNDTTSGTQQSNTAS